MMSCKPKETNVPATSNYSINKSSNGRSTAIGPLAVLPEEAWELILNQLEDSQDICHFFIAYPQLDRALHSKKPSFLFQLVLPHIMTKYLVQKRTNIQYNWLFCLRSNELFNLRLVSKRWKHAVESCIQNHADRHPPLPKSQNDHNHDNPDNLIVPEHHFSYQRMYKYHFGATIFLAPQQIDEFMEDMNSFNGNPFPGKFVYCDFSYSSDVATLPLFVPKLVEMLQKFGKHVHVLDCKIFDNDNRNLENFKTILKGLSYCPNLRSLTIHGMLGFGQDYPDDTTSQNFFKQSESQQLFPDLPFLKIFEWKVAVEKSSTWVNRMIDKYAKQNDCLRKLTIDVNYCKTSVVSRLKNVSELHLFLSSYLRHAVTSIRNVLQLFPLGQLRKFCLSYNPSRGCLNINVKELLEILSEFKIQVVVLEQFILKGSPFNDHDPVNISNIISLHFDDSFDLSFEFLKLLPSLKFLHIYVDSHAFHSSWNRDSFTKSLSSYFSKTCYKDNGDEWIKPNIPRNFSIWKEIPNLEMLSASVDHIGILEIQFAKECENQPF